MTEPNNSLSPAPAAPTRRRFRFAPLLMMGALVAGGLGVLAMGQGASADRGPGMEHHGGGHGDHGPGGMMGMMGGRQLDRMMERVDATEEQRGKIREIARTARNDVEKLTDQLRPMRKAALDQLTAPTVDRAAVEGLRSRVSGVTDEISKRVTLAMVDAAQVLTAEQRSKLAEEMNSRRRGPMSK